jgi:hypothetical protein
MADSNIPTVVVRGNKTKVLSSDWTGLSPHLLARFYPVRKLADGSGWEQGRKKDGTVADQYVADDGIEVHAPMTDGTSELTLNWNSPFENAGAESKAPALSAMLQSGSLTSMLQGIGSAGIMPDMLGDLAKQSADISRKIEGKTGITKLNSTQIFSGMPPIKLTFTLHFRAFKDAVKEVREPILKLKEWALPQMLAADGLVAGAIKNGANQNMFDTLFPSLTPQVVGMRYGDMTYQPMVIESVSEPITNPRTDKGVMTACSVQITLATLAALDRADYRKIYL